jgi:hypothetical protein
MILRHDENCLLFDDEVDLNWMDLVEAIWLPSVAKKFADLVDEIFC